MKKIAFIIGSMGRGGAERVISILSKSYAERGYHTDIIMLLSNTVGYDLHPTTGLIDFSGDTESRIKRLPYWIKSIRKYVKDEKPDVIVSFAARINVIVKSAIFGLRTRLIVSERNDPRYDGRSGVVDLITKLQYPHTDCVVFQTRRARDYFPKLKNSAIIPNPITVECAADVGQGLKIATAGRLTKQKNQKLLIDAFSDVAEKHPTASLDIYGEGELRESLREQIQSLGLEGRVVLRGNAKDLHRRMSDASLFCLSSDYEGLSNALLEAMMMGLPCISTNCAGADEYIINGENGFLVDVGDREGLAVALDALLSDAALRQAFSAKAKSATEKLSVENIMAEWDRVILGSHKNIVNGD